MESLPGVHVLVVGCGAISSFLLSLLAGMTRIARITLVDPGSYEKSNLGTQNIFPGDVGEQKVAVQARRLRVANPRLQVAAIPALVGDIPLALLRADLIAGCVDSKLARQTINEIAWRHRIPWVDAGVLASQGLARVSVIVPGDEAACLLCAWSDADYAALEVEYPCGASDADAPHSDLSANLACLAASLQAVECDRLIRDRAAAGSVSRQITVDAHAHRMLSTVFRRHPDCRFDHAAWHPVLLRCSLQRTAIADVLATTGRVSVAGHRFALKLVCPRCAFQVEGLRLDRPKLQCPRCYARMVPPDFASLLPQLDGSLPAELLGRSLAQVGLLPADVINGIDKQFEILPEVL